MLQGKYSRGFPPSTLSYLAAGLFCLAGVVEMVAAALAHNAALLSIGAMFLCVGGMWFAIGVRFKKKEANGASGE